MIYEFRTYTIIPRSLPEFLNRFEERLAARQTYSKLWAFWYSEIGPLNQVIHVWAYKDALERSQIRAQALASGNWPPNTFEFIVDMQSEIFEAVPFVTPLEAGPHGPYYEMRTYTLKPGALPTTVAAWKEKMAARTALSSCLGLFISDIGGLNKWMHIWPYKSLQQREDTRKAAVASGQWPPNSPVVPIRQENKILLPSKFSPMQ